MIFWGSGRMSFEKALHTFNEIHGPFYKHHIGVSLTETSQVAEPVEV